MVSFICDACGQTVKKNRVEKHYLTECRNCSVLSCIDCGKDFHGDEYSSHNSCISEAEKYQGKLYRPKENANKGELKQQEWMKQIHKASSSVVDPKLKNYLMKISEYSNVPRKKGKFLNFCKHSLRVYDETILEKLWEAFEKQEKSQTQAKEDKTKTICDKSNDEILSHKSLNSDVEKSNGEVNEKNGKKKRKREVEKVETETNNENGDENTKSKKKRKEKKAKSKKDEIEQNIDNSNEMSAETNAEKQPTGKFNWQKTIKVVLKDAGNDGIAIKKLRKKVFAAYQEHGTNYNASSKEECYSIFKKKLAGYPKAKVIKEQVFYKS